MASYSRHLARPLSGSRLPSLSETTTGDEGVETESELANAPICADYGSFAEIIVAGGAVDESDDFSPQIVQPVSLEFPQRHFSRG